MTKLSDFNSLEEDFIVKELLKCCHSKAWAQKMSEGRPYSDLHKVLTTAEEIWFNLSEGDWLEAFEAHPKIGDMDSLRKKFHATKDQSEKEQSGVAGTSEKTLEELALVNHKYHEKFGFIFIVFATGKSAEEMLKLLKARIGNTREQELKNAATEQTKITRLRLEKMF